MPTSKSAIFLEALRFLAAVAESLLVLAAAALAAGFFVLGFPFGLDSSSPSPTLLLSMLSKSSSLSILSTGVVLAVALAAALVAGFFFADALPFGLSSSSSSSPNLLLSSLSSSSSLMLLSSSPLFLEALPFLMAAVEPFFVLAAVLVEALAAGFFAFGFAFGVNSSSSSSLPVLPSSVSSSTSLMLTSTSTIFLEARPFLAGVVEAFFVLAAALGLALAAAFFALGFALGFKSSSSSLPLLLMPSLSSSLSRWTISTSLFSST
mmetsp:Transcript_8693/g.15242  ORF Transcript_8693/g.15242 Transcript_8693/m.15242 type:complete len:264 (-) Transcript_8693:381-1172(-)